MSVKREPGAFALGNLVDEITRRNATALVTGPLASGPTASELAGGGSSVNEDFEIALGPAGRAAVELGLKLNPGVNRRINTTLSEFAGRPLRPGELNELRDRVLDAAEKSDVDALRGVYLVGEKPPVYMTPSQKAVTDKLVGTLGSDPLGREVQGSYGRAVEEGRIRIIQPKPKATR
jgi:hypothetical protein